MNENNDDEKEEFIDKKNENILLKEKYNNISSKDFNQNFLKINPDDIFKKEDSDIKDEYSFEKNESKEIICPKCEKSCYIDIFDYQILLYGCKNNHKTNNIFFKEFEHTQIIEKSKIICDVCKESKKNKLLDDEFYTCLECKMDLCSSCELNHDKTHNIINYKQKNYICKKHNKSYSSYCKNCKKDICDLCEKKHINHEIINYINILPNKNELKIRNNELKLSLNKLKENINEIIKIFENVVKNLELYYKIYNDIIFGYDNINLNYKLLYNINKISKKSDILENINKINNENLLLNKIIIIYDIYKKMNIKENNEITINYKIEKNKKEIKIFNHTFISNNKNNCKIIYNDKEYELQEKFKINNNDKILTIKLRGIRNITNMGYLFCGCESLLSVPDISNWNTLNIVYMHYIFCGCKSLFSLPDISKWDTSNVLYMNNMFNGCSSLEYLPDISKWDTSKVINMDNMFNGCSSLEYLPDISKWDISKIHYKKNMFDGCKSSLKIPLKFKQSFFESIFL